LRPYTATVAPGASGLAQVTVVVSVNDPSEYSFESWLTSIPLGASRPAAVGVGAGVAVGALVGVAVGATVGAAEGEAVGAWVTVGAGAVVGTLDGGLAAAPQPAKVSVATNSEPDREYKLPSRQGVVRRPG